MKEEKKPMDIKEIMADYNKAVKFFHETPAEVWEMLGQKNALSVFNEIKEKIPAYKNFLNEHHFSDKVESIENFTDIPIMDKYNYIQKYGFNEVNTVKAGKDLYSFSLSSGTADEPTVWPRYYDYEDKVLPMLVDFYMRLTCQLDKKSTLLINALALGPWTGGMMIHPGFRALTQKYRLTYATPGTDAESVVQTIKKMSKFYDQVVMWAYPTFTRTVMDKLLEAKINLKELNLKLFVGAEGHTIEWWQYLNKLICGDAKSLTTIMDAFGMSEGGMPGLGSSLTNLIRVLCQKDEKLKNAIFGETGAIPNIFQYNPASNYIEEINGELVFTTKNTTPLVRYNLHDRGGLISFRKMENILSDHGYDYKKLLEKNGVSEEMVWQQPFFYCRGRGGDAVIIGGGNVYPEQIAPVLFDGKIKIVNSFKLSRQNDEEQHQLFYLFLELKEGLKLSDKETQKTEKKFHDLVMKHLLRINRDYAESYNADPKYSDLIVRIFDYRDGPFDADSKFTKTRFVI